MVVPQAVPPLLATQFSLVVLRQNCCAIHEILAPGTGLRFHPTPIDMSCSARDDYHAAQLTRIDINAREVPG